jgi:hypothetical protein
MSTVRRTFGKILTIAQKGYPVRDTSIYRFSGEKFPQT